MYESPESAGMVCISDPPEVEVGQIHTKNHQQKKHYGITDSYYWKWWDVDFPVTVHCSVYYSVPVIEVTHNLWYEIEEGEKKLENCQDKKREK